MQLLFRCLSFLPLVILQSLGACLGWLAFLLSPSYRRQFLANARQAGYSFAQVGGAVVRSGMMLAELPRLWLGRPVAYQWQGRELIDAAFARGKGVLFLTPHMGCFEISPQAMARDYSSQFGPMTVLFRPARKPWLTELVRTARTRPGLEAVPTNLTGVRQLVRALRAGRAVGMLPDQVPPDGMGAWTPFFGRDAYTMTLAARLWQQTQATLLLARVERISWGRGFRIHISEIGSPANTEDLRCTVIAINASIESLIRTAPNDYLWGYARYKLPRVERAIGS